VFKGHRGHARTPSYGHKTRGQLKHEVQKPAATIGFNFVFHLYQVRAYGFNFVSLLIVLGSAIATPL